MNKSSWFLLATLLASAAGCMNFENPPPQIRDYRLDYPPPAFSGKPLPVILRVGFFGTAAVYDREAIIYRTDTYTTGTYFYERWMAPPGSMVTDLLTRDIVSSGVYKAIEQGASTIPIDYDLNGEIEEIEERITENESLAHLRLRVLLSRARSRPSADRIMFQKTYEANEPSSGKSVEDFVSAMSTALQTISADIQRDVYDAIAGDSAS